MPDHFLRISDNAWKKLRLVAFTKEMRMKAALDKIMTGEIDPSQYEYSVETAPLRIK